MGTYKSCFSKKCETKEKFDGSSQLAVFCIYLHKNVIFSLSYRLKKYVLVLFQLKNVLISYNLHTNLNTSPYLRPKSLSFSFGFLPKKKAYPKTGTPMGPGGQLRSRYHLNINFVIIKATTKVHNKLVTLYAITFDTTLYKPNAIVRGKN